MSGGHTTGSVVQGFEPAFGVDRCHAAGSGGGDGLAVVVVDDVAAGEHARDLGDAGVRFLVDERIVEFYETMRRM